MEFKPMKKIIIFIIFGLSITCLGLYGIKGYKRLQKIVYNQKVAIEETEIPDNFPLKNFFPLTTDRYKLVYLREKTLLVTPIRNIDKEILLGDVKNWVKAQSIDPESHKYVFVIAGK